MKDRLKSKSLLAILGMLLVLTLAAMPVLAASENTEAVLEQLGVLQRADISPDWQPDVRANEQHVQRLLDLYLACSATERQEFSAQQTADLKAYFTALYAVQGKSTADVDALFETGGASSPASSSAPSSGSGPSSSQVDSSAPVPSSLPQSQADSSAGAASSSAGASQAAPSSSSEAVVSGVASGSEAGGTAAGGDLSLPAATYPPQSPGGGGWFALFGNRALGIGVLLVLAALVVFLFVRFIFALRKARKIPKDEEAAAVRAQELFGEDYEEKLKEDDIDPQALLDRLPEAEEEKPGETPATSEPASKAVNAREIADRILGTGAEAAANDLPDVGAERKRPARRPRPVKPPPVVLDEPEAAQPPVTLRSFSGPVPNGKPGKMTFRQGDPNDIDAIDE